MKKLVMQFEEKDGKSFKIELPDARDDITMAEVNAFTGDIIEKSILDRSIEGFTEAYLLNIERQEIS